MMKVCATVPGLIDLFLLYNTWRAVRSSNYSMPAYPKYDRYCMYALGLVYSSDEEDHVSFTCLQGMDAGLYFSLLSWDICCLRVSMFFLFFYSSH